jgi:hypothetical protein
VVPQPALSPKPTRGPTPQKRSDFFDGFQPLASPLKFLVETSEHLIMGSDTGSFAISPELRRADARSTELPELKARHSFTPGLFGPIGATGTHNALKITFNVLAKRLSVGILIQITEVRKSAALRQ